MLRWSPDLFPKLQEAVEVCNSYGDIGRFLGVTRNLARNWVKRHLPDKFVERSQDALQKSSPNQKWSPCLLPKLQEAVEIYDTYKKMGEFLSVSSGTAKNWVKKYLPEEFARRKRNRHGWRDEYLPVLDELCERGATFEDVRERFNIGPSTARDWVLRYLGRDVFDEVAAAACHQTRGYPQEVKEEARKRRLEGAYLREIEEELGPDGPAASTLSRWLKGVPCGVRYCPDSLPPDPFDGHEEDDEDDDFFGYEGEPTAADLDAIEQGFLDVFDSD